MILGGAGGMLGSMFSESDGRVWIVCALALQWLTGACGCRALGRTPAVAWLSVGGCTKPPPLSFFRSLNPDDASSMLVI